MSERQPDLHPEAHEHQTGEDCDPSREGDQLLSLTRAGLVVAAEVRLQLTGGIGARPLD